MVGDDPSLGSAKPGTLLVTAQFGAECHEWNCLLQRTVRPCLCWAQSRPVVFSPVNKTALNSQNRDTEHLTSPSLGFCLW